MVSLQDFQTYPGPGETSILEKDGRLSNMQISEVNISTYEHPLIALYPDINISRDLCHFAGQQSPHYSSDDADSPPRNATTTTASPPHILKPVDEPLIKRCSRIFFEDGIVAALQEAAATRPAQLDAHQPPHDNRGRLVLNTVARQALRLFDILARAQLYVQPQLRHATVALNAVRLSQTRDWTRSLIRTMAWHGHQMRLAVAACDDNVRIYVDVAGSVPVLLKNHLQRDITSMSWRPFTAGDLAVGCQQGVLVWSWDPKSNVARPLSQPLHLKHDRHVPVMAVAWSADGRLLATASCADSDINLWDVDLQQRVALHRVGAPGALLSWSPNGRKMFTSTVGKVFRVWSTHDWTPERWTVPLGVVQSATWSPCGGYLLFVTTGESYIYSLCFVEEQLFTNSSTPKAALPVVDLTQRTIGTTEVGGRPQTIVWDPAGKRLAVTFKDTAVVAIFLTEVGRTRLSIVPDCLLVGLGAEVPQHIAFQPRYAGKPETVLAIGWSTGRVQFFPFM